MSTTEYNGTNYDRILNYITIIQRKPKKDVKFFYFDEGKKFIVEGHKLKLLPLEYHQFYDNDEFYVHVNPTEKRVMYYAYDIKNYEGDKHVNEKEGYIPWDDIEDCIYNFFVMHVKELADTTTPYIDVQEPVKKTPKTYDYRNGHDYSGYNGGYNTGYKPEPFGYGTSAYKEREAFYDKLWDLLKVNKSSQALDHINVQLKKMREDKKFDELDVLIKSISFDKLTIPTMLGVLDATIGADDLLKSRKDFFDKVKTHIMKVRPSRAAKILHKLEPVKAVKQKNDTAGASKTH